jgi:hypothetical protein
MRAIGLHDLQTCPTEQRTNGNTHTRPTVPTNLGGIQKEGGILTFYTYLKEVVSDPSGNSNSTEEMFPAASRAEAKKRTCIVKVMFVFSRRLR